MGQTSVKEGEDEVYSLRRNRTREGKGQISFFSSFLSFSSSHFVSLSFSFS
jgi:hypothetical protein